MRTPTAAALAGAVLLAVALSACGSSSSGSATGATTTSPAATTATAGANDVLAAARARYSTLKAPMDAAFASAKLAKNAKPEAYQRAETKIAKASYAFGTSVNATVWPDQAQAAATAFLADLHAAVLAEQAAAEAKTYGKLRTAIGVAAAAQTKANASESTFRQALGFAS